MGTRTENLGLKGNSSHETSVVPVRIPVPIYNSLDQLSGSEGIRLRNSDLTLISEERKRALKDIEMRSGHPASIRGKRYGRAFGGLGLIWAIDNTPYRLGERYNAHGITQEDPVLRLNEFLTKGVDRSRNFYSMPFANVGEDEVMWFAPHPHHNGGIIIISDVDKFLISDGVKFVVLGEECNRVVDLLRKKYPDFEFVPWHLAPKVLSERLEEKTGKAVRVQELNDNNRPFYPILSSRIKKQAQA